MPYYFSGTNCRASGFVAIGEPPAGWQGYWGLKSLKLFVGLPGLEQQVHELNFPQYGEPIAGGGIAAMFDSSQWQAFSPSGPVISVRVEGRDSNDGLYTATGLSVIKNQVACFELPEFEFFGRDGAKAVETYLKLANYSSPMTYEEDWDAGLFESECRRTVIYVNSHGDHFGFDLPNASMGSGTPKIWHSAGNDPSISDMRASWNGFGLPPYNSLDNPPNAVTAWPMPNLALAHYCNSLDDDSAVSYLEPTLNYYLSVLENQAVQGFTVYTKAVQSELLAQLIMTPLVNGQSILAADNALDYGDFGLLAQDVSGGPWREWAPGDSEVIGDYYTKIKTVYDPSSHNPGGWARPL